MRYTNYEIWKGYRADLTALLVKEKEAKFRTVWGNKIIQLHVENPQFNKRWFEELNSQGQNQGKEDYGYGPKCGKDFKFYRHSSSITQEDE